MKFWVLLFLSYSVNYLLKVRKFSLELLLIISSNLVFISNILVANFIIFVSNILILVIVNTGRWQHKINLVYLSSPIFLMNNRIGKKNLPYHIKKTQWKLCYFLTEIYSSIDWYYVRHVHNVRDLFISEKEEQWIVSPHLPVRCISN